MSDKKLPNTEDKKPCDVCGEMISSHHLAIANHMKKHQKVVVGSESKKQEDLNQEEDRKILERALAAQESFRKAPGVFLSVDTTDNNAELINIYAQEAVDRYDNTGKMIKKASRHPFFSDRKELVKWANRGYVPVLGDNGEFVQNEGGDVLTTCDRALFEAREKKPQNESSSMVKSLHKDLSKDKVCGEAEGHNEDLQNMSLKVTEEEITL